MIGKAADYLMAFSAAFLPTLALVPAVRALLKRAGMVDMPGERRINKIPVPRGGGIALVLGTLVPYAWRGENVPMGISMTQALGIMCAVASKGLVFWIE